MKLLFIPGKRNRVFAIDGENINSIPLSEIQDGESFALPEMREAGIHKAERINGELFVTLEQACTVYRYPVYSHDWRESDWIDASDANLLTCLCKPISVYGKEDWYFEWVDEMELLPSGVERSIKGWTVMQEIPPEPELEVTEEPTA